MHNNSFLEIDAQAYRDRMEEKAEMERLRRLATMKDMPISPLPEAQPVHHSSTLAHIGKAIIWPVRMVRRIVFLLPIGH